MQRRCIPNLHFEPTLKIFRPKQYKYQFKKWDWHKNLPKEKARFMRSKTIQRRREKPPKDTKFRWGGRYWTGDQVIKSLKGEEGGDRGSPYLGQYIVYFLS